MSPTQHSANVSSPLPSEPPSAAITREMEDEVFGLLGALLGLLEVLSIDVREPLTQRQQSVVSDALKFGDKLRARVEAMVTLLGDPGDPRHQATDYSLRRLMDHAVRGANWAATEKGVRMVLPDYETLGQTTVRIDAARVDRSLRAITDALLASLTSGSELHVSLERSETHATIELRGHGSPLAPLDVPKLLVLAWQRVFALHGGRVQLDREQASVRVELAQGEQR